MKITILNAYRRSNAGDGLLVDIATTLAHEAFPDAEVRLVAMEPSGFPEHPDGLQPVAGHSERMTVPNLVARLLTRRAHPAVVSAIRDSDLAICVGGGYLRGDTVSSTAKSFLSHVVQAPTWGTTTPYVYLPQSIGPIPARLLPFGISRLRRAAAVFVRDDRSHRELAARGVAALRFPDLAVLEIGDALLPRGNEPGHSSGPALVARDLQGRNAAYEHRLHQLHSMLSPETLVQSSGAGNDDPAFYRRMGWNAASPRLQSVLASDTRPSVVVSVRLHGALQAILAGIPAIHLSYERKGWGAYEDLGISEYVHNAWKFDPDLVAQQARALSVKPERYWSAVRERQAELRAKRGILVEVLRGAGRR